MMANAPPPTANQNQIGTPSGYTPNKVKSVTSDASSVVGIDVVELKVPVVSLAALVVSMVIVDDDDEFNVATDSADSIREYFSVEIVDVGFVSVSEIWSVVEIISTSSFVVAALVVIISTSVVVDIEDEVVEVETISTLRIEVGIDS